MGLVLPSNTPPNTQSKGHSLVTRLRQTNARIQASDAQQSPVEIKLPHSGRQHKPVHRAQKLNQLNMVSKHSRYYAT